MWWVLTMDDAQVAGTPMAAAAEDGAERRWLEKAVLDSRRLAEMVAADG